MKILITNNHLVQWGGSETWVYTMYNELKKRGFDVKVHTKEKGYISSLMEIDDNPKGYDLALINHNTCLDVDAKFKIFTSHGTVPELEIPKPGAHVYVAVNENVAEKYDLEHIIKNPIDTELYKPISPINEKIKTVLNITHTALDLPYEIIKPSRTADNMPELMNKSDLVVSIGRGVLEAMSCGRNVIIWDVRPYWGSRGDGYLKDFVVLKGNVAGEYLNTRINLNEEAEKYNPKQGELNRQYILDNHDVRLIVDEYLWITKHAT